MSDVLPSVLIVDDNDDDAMIATMALRRGTVEIGKILRARDGDEAIAMFRDSERSRQSLPGFPPNVVFLDINMPIMDGWEFLDAYHALDDRSAFATDIYVMISSELLTEERDRARAYPAVVDALVKPIDRALVARIFQSEPGRPGERPSP